MLILFSGAKRRGRVQNAQRWPHRITLSTFERTRAPLKCPTLHSRVDRACARASTQRRTLRVAHMPLHISGYKCHATWRAQAQALSALGSRAFAENNILFKLAACSTRCKERKRAVGGAGKWVVVVALRDSSVLRRFSTDRMRVTAANKHTHTDSHTQSEFTMP